MSKQYIIDRLQEPSTWRAIILILTACGVPIAPELANQVIAAGIGIAGVIGVVTPDKLK